MSGGQSRTGGVRMLRNLAHVIVLLATLGCWSLPTAQPTVERGSSRTEQRAEALVLGRAERHVRLVFTKDPLLAVYLSTTVPGLGQIYAGQWQRGTLFLGGIFASVSAAYVATLDTRADLWDYEGWDSELNGGKGAFRTQEQDQAEIDQGRQGLLNGQIDYLEYRAWSDGELNRDRFSQLSGAEKFIWYGGVTTAIGLYVWNIYDAYSQAQQYNRKLYHDLTGVQLGMTFGADGRPRAQLSLPF